MRKMFSEKQVKNMSVDSVKEAIESGEIQTGGTWTVYKEGNLIPTETSSSSTKNFSTSITEEEYDKLNSTPYFIVINLNRSNIWDVKAVYLNPNFPRGIGATYSSAQGTMTYELKFTCVASASHTPVTSSVGTYQVLIYE